MLRGEGRKLMGEQQVGEQLQRKRREKRDEKRRDEGKWTGCGLRCEDRRMCVVSALHMPFNSTA
jgi:ferredoxin